MPPDDFGFVTAKAADPFGFVAAPRVKEDVGLFQAAASGASQGAFGAGDEIGAGLQAMAATSGRQASPGAANKLFLDTFRQSRAENRDIDKRSAEQHPWVYYPSLLASSLATSRMLPALAPAVKGAPLAFRAATSMLNAVPTGLAFGAGNSEADLTRPTADNISRFVSDVEGSGATAGLLGLGGTLVSRGIAAAPGALKSLALKAGSKVLGGKVSPEAIEQAIRRGAIRMFGTTEGASGRLTADLEAKLGPEYGAYLKFLETNGVRGPDATVLADQWINQAAHEQANTLGSQVPEMYLQHAKEIAPKAPGTYAGEWPRGGWENRLGLRQAANVTRDLQSRAKYNPLVDTATNDARRAIASDARQAVEDAVAQHETSADPLLSKAAQSFVPIKQRLGNAIEAEAAASRAADKSKSLGLMDLASGAAASVAGGSTHGARGVLAGLPATVATHLARTRGPSTVASAAYGSSRFMDWLGKPVGKALESASEWYGPVETERRAAQQFLSRVLGLPALTPNPEGLNAP